ncbi:Crotonobetainyl-CoA:carnitine CoA-transferase CaiB [Parasphingorhabdus marina DSM 22363]|uniref:Crotonobetainyl-CoA:carnitine CoA-transferase CaiB n=2 Tax=Parasphingorhabdus marina TaxID=394732 RepID=A0A1N6D1H9_9SPHN|nr:Crotonobetainyl-CoA:carnitine CoA-transferase CaiB [Parasphingorhabdus marina DSM 22363]
MLDGIRVVELGVWVAGPAAGAMLADWGADVIKVEPPAGDPQRGVFRALGLKDGRVPPFEQDNRGKRSLVLDLRSEAELETFHKLLETADIFISNMRPTALEKYGLDGASVRSRHPHLIFGRITGYGSEGPDVNRAGYDVGGFWSRAGVPTRIVTPDTPPPNIPPGFGDHMTAVSLVSGLMAALFRRERSGEGAVVDTSLLRTGIYGLSADFSMQMFFGKLMPRTTREEAEAPLVNCYKTRDGKWIWMLAVESTRHWPNLLKALDREDWGKSAEFSSAKERYRNKIALVAAIDAETVKYDREELGRRFDAHDVWWAPVQTVDEVVADPQAVAAGAFIDIPGGHGEDNIRGVANPVSFNDNPVQARGSAPGIGEHSDALRNELDQTRE